VNSKHEYEFFEFKNHHLIKVQKERKDGDIFLYSNVFSSKIVMKSETQKYFPESLYFYNQNRNGVDLYNQLIAYYRNNSKTNKLWKSVFLHLLNIVIFNPFLYRDFIIQNPLIKSFY
jgi:hypothetical protein